LSLDGISVFDHLHSENFVLVKFRAMPDPPL